jgi:protein ImuB
VILCLTADWDGVDLATAGESLVAQGFAPRVAVEERDGIAGGGNGRLWVDVRGLPAQRVAASCVEALRAGGARRIRYGVAATPVAAWAAAAAAVREDEGGAVVRPGGDRAFLARLPLSVLEPDGRLCELLEGVGVETCGGLAALDREAVEVRFGGEAVRVWRWSRADDDRRLFRPVPREAPGASLDFVDYVVSDPERLLFTANALLGNVCDALAERGSHTRSMTLTLALANGATWTRTIGAARPTASRTTWLRRIRAKLERLTVPDAVAGVTVAADSSERAAAIQGDLFDAGFATAAAVDDALDLLLETQDAVIVRPAASGHPLAERRMSLESPDSAPASRMPWRDAARQWKGGDRTARRDPTGASSNPAASRDGSPETEVDAQTTPGPVAGLTLQLLKEPRPVLVETVARRDHVLPVRYRDGSWRQLHTAAGPERLSGGQWEAAYAREYYRCVAVDGLLVWLYRDGRDGQWYLHGWWD